MTQKDSNHLSKSPQTDAIEFVQQPIPSILAPDINIPDGCDEKTFVEYREDTQQVPAGDHSILAALEMGEITATQAAAYLVANAKSNWDSGRTHKLSHKTLGDIIGRSRGHVSRLVSGLGDFARRATKLGITSIYKLTHHNCDANEVPTDDDGQPLKCAVARGAGGPVERLEAGEIALEDFLLWMVIHIRFADWGTQQAQVSIARLREATRLGEVTILNSIKRLITVGLLEKVGKRHPHEAQCYQLYPRMRERKERKIPATARDWRDIVPDAQGWYQSFNGLWRLNHKTLEIQRRPSRQKGLWREATDKEKTEMPKKLKIDFGHLLHHLTQIKQWRENMGYAQE